MSPLDAELVVLMHETVTVEKWIGQDKFGDSQFDEPVVAKCKIVRASKRGIGVDGRVLAAREGREVVATANIFMADPTLQVTMFDRITLPGGEQPSIQEIHAADDETGPYYLEIRL